MQHNGYFWATAVSIVAAIYWIAYRMAHPRPASRPLWNYPQGQRFTSIQKGKIMIKMSADHPNVTLALAKPVVRDSEGGHIPSAYITTRVNSSDGDVLAATLNDAGDSVELEFVHAGTASFEVSWDYDPGDGTGPVQVDADGFQVMLRPAAGAVTIEARGGIDRSQLPADESTSSQ